MTRDLLVHANFRIKAPDGRILVEKHNVLTDHGRDHVLGVLGTTSGAAVLKYLGFGIGGDGSGVTPDPDAVNSAFTTDYPGTNVQSDSVSSITKLERPVKAYSSGGTDYWLVEPTITYSSSPKVWMKLSYTLATSDLNIGTYPTVPFSEVGLFLSDESDTLDPYSGSAQQPFAYVTFAPQNKLDGSTMDVEWVIRI